ncbi:FkbM family methyltransferase [Rhabdaerophilum sp. SD176]|uniref:FkbM family methyltransferase n=1 Tax=Rhabdaerophilum sp. SD176 TaxID=2983548 RepID=UPI0024DF771E|nr:FkbM family methyltransferase [Rhabdaerophilum sp. SD176]
MPIAAYAQNHEDIMLWRLFGQGKPGFYVDVGAQDPEIDSVTKLFYDHGWSGLNVEPVAEYAEKLKSERPRDINLDCLVGASDAVLTFFHVEGTGLSTTRRDLAELYSQQGKTVLEEQREVLRLQTLFERYAVAEVDFLKVDTEGSEADVLKGLDFGRVRPKVLIVESTLPNTREENHQEWEPHLLENGYHLAYRDGLNRFYLDTPFLMWKAHFQLPPNHFDGFTPALAVQEQKAAKAYQKRLHATIDQLHGNIADLQAALERIKIDLVSGIEATGRHHRLIIETMDDQLQALERARLQAVNDVARIQGELDHVRSVHEWAVRTRSWRWTAPLRRYASGALRSMEYISALGHPLLRRRQPVCAEAPAGPISPNPVHDGLPEAGRWLAVRLSAARSSQGARPSA